MGDTLQRRLHDRLAASPSALRLVRVLNRLLTVAVYALYILLCLGLLVLRDGRLLRVLAVPAFVFLSGSALRAGINAPRPYENGGPPNLLGKQTRGKSFPSRHVFCAACITAAWAWTVPASAFLLVPVTLAIAAMRIAGGVHWPRDVFAGLAYGGILGVIGFYFL